MRLKLRWFTRPPRTPKINFLGFNVQKHGRTRRVRLTYNSKVVFSIHNFSLLCSPGPTSVDIFRPTAMPLNLSAAQSSRISKRPQQKIPLLRRSASSPFTGFVQRKSIQRSKSKADVADDNDDDDFGDRLDDIGIVKSLASDLSLRDLVQTIQYVRSHMFESMPENGGFNSTRIAEILSTYFPSP